MNDMTSPHGTAVAHEPDAAEKRFGGIITHSGRLLTAWVGLLLLWAPLPFGGVTPWALALLQGLAFVAFALAVWSVERLGDLRPAAAPAAALLGIALLGFLQALPWPAGWVGALSPGHADLWRQAAELPGVAAPSSPHLSFAPSATRGAALTWVAMAAALLAGAAVGRWRVRRRWLLVALGAGALFQIFFGMQQWFARSDVLWGVKIARAPRLQGTFVNPNHLALFLEMVLPAVLAWAWWATRQARKETQVERKLVLLAPPFLAWLVVFLGLAFTGSRGGLLGAVAGLGVQVLALAVARRRRTAFAGLGVLGAGLAVVAAVGLREGLGRALETSWEDVAQGARIQEYAGLLDLWRRFPVLGTGLGSFRDAFPQVQPLHLEGSWWHAHSDLLEILVTTGLVGVAVLVAGLWPVPIRLFRVLAGRGRSENRAAALAVLGALASVVVHEAVDFGLAMPGNAILLAILVGAGMTVPAAPTVPAVPVDRGALPQP